MSMVSIELCRFQYGGSGFEKGTRSLYCLIPDSARRAIWLQFYHVVVSFSTKLKLEQQF